MPNQRDPGKKLVGGYVTTEVKREIARLGIEEATAVEMLLVESLVRHGYMKHSEVERMAAEGRLRPGSVIFLRSVGILKSPVPLAKAAS